MRLVFVHVKDKIQDSHRIHGLELKISVAPFRLFADGKGGVIKHPVLEEILLALLQLDNELLASFILAVEVEDGLAVDIGVTELFCLQVGQIPYFPLFLFE